MANNCLCVAVNIGEFWVRCVGRLFDWNRPPIYGELHRDRNAPAGWAGSPVFLGRKCEWTGRDGSAVARQQLQLQHPLHEWGRNPVLGTRVYWSYIHVDGAYESWHVLNVPAAPANRFFIKIYCANNVVPQYVSGVLTLEPGPNNFPEFLWPPFTCMECVPLQVTEPNGWRTWQVGQTDTVRWQFPGYNGQMKIELNRNYPAGTWELLVDSTANDGEETVFVTAPSSQMCRMRVSGVSDPVSDITDLEFWILCPPTPPPFADEFDGPTFDSCWVWRQDLIYPGSGA